MLAKRHYLRRLLWLSLILPAFTVAQSNSSEAESAKILAERLFQDVESRFQKIRTLRFTVERTVQLGKSTQIEKWIFAFKQPDNLCIECLAPQPRKILFDGRTLLEYLPEKGKAMRTDLALLDENEQLATISSVLSRVSLEGIRLGDFSRMLEKVVSFEKRELDGRSICVVEGRDPRYLIRVDQSKKVLLETELYYESGRLRLRTEASQFIEADPSFWFPGKLCSTYRTELGVVQAVARLSGISVDEDLSELFSFSLSPDVEIISR